MLNSKFWAKYFKEYDALNELDLYKQLLEKIVKLLGVRRDENILEAGCGTGNLCLLLSNAGGNVWGVDNNQFALEKYKTKKPFAKTLQTSISDLSNFEDNHFDKISSVHTVYWLNNEEQLKAISEFTRVLKIGGKLLIVNPKNHFSSLAIYKENFKFVKKERGFFIALFLLVKFLIPASKLIIYTNKLIKNKKESKYFLSLEKLEQILSKKNYKIIHTQDVYADQSYLLLAEKQ